MGYPILVGMAMGPGESERWMGWDGWGKSVRAENPPYGAAGGPKFLFRGVGVRGRIRACAGGCGMWGLAGWNWVGLSTPRSTYHSDAQPSE